MQLSGMYLIFSLPSFKNPKTEFIGDEEKKIRNKEYMY